MRSSTLRLVVCASLAAIVLGQRPLPGFGGQAQEFIPQRQQQNRGQQSQLVNQGFGGQVNQGFGNQLNQGFGGQQNIQSSQPLLNTRPVNSQRQQQQQVIVNQPTEILEDVRDGPFWDGSYYFRYQSADGSVREEGGRPLADGTIQVTGSYGYRAPNGEIFEMEYIADTNGYRAFKKGTRGDFVQPQRAFPPQGLPPFQQNFNGGNNVVAQPQPRPVARPRPTQTQIQVRPINNQNQVRPINNQNQVRPIITQNPVRRPINNQVINQAPSPVQSGINNNFLRPGNQFNTNIRPTPGSFQGFGQRNQGINFSGASSDDTFVALDSPQNNINTQDGIIFN